MRAASVVICTLESYDKPIHQLIPTADLPVMELANKSYFPAFGWLPANLKDLLGFERIVSIADFLRLRQYFRWSIYQFK